jgi:hypothetical protein
MAWTHLILGHFSIPNGIARGSAGFVLESKSTVFRNSRTKNWLQLRCVHPIGAGVGVKLCSAEATPSRSRPASAANQQAPTLTRPHKRGGDGRRRPFPSSRAPFFNRDGPGWGEPLPSRARNPLSIAPCFCRKSAEQPGRHRSLNYCTTGPPNPRTTHNPRPPCGQGNRIWRDCCLSLL